MALTEQESAQKFYAFPVSFNCQKGGNPQSTKYGYHKGERYSHK